MIIKFKFVFDDVQLSIAVLNYDYEIQICLWRYATIDEYIQRDRLSRSVCTHLSAEPNLAPQIICYVLLSVI